VATQNLIRSANVPRKAATIGGMKQQQTLGHGMPPREDLTRRLASAASATRFIGSPVMVLALTCTLLLL
jgi:hypothetical protein